MSVTFPFSCFVSLIIPKWPWAQSWFPVPLYQMWKYEIIVFTVADNRQIASPLLALEYTTVEFSLVRISWTRSLCSDRVTAYVTKRIFLHLPEKSMPSCSTEVETLLISFAHASPRLKRPALCATLWISSRVKLVTKSILLLTPEAKTKIVISLQAGSLWEWVRVGPSQTRSQGAPFGVGRAFSYTTV